MNEKNILISVIVLTYKTDMMKLYSTLRSIVCQEKVNIEIIITDDGTEGFDRTEVEAFFEKKDFEKYVILDNAKNVGTIKNYIRGLEAAKGEWVYGISPGDMLYDPYVLSDFLQFVLKTGADFCFGNAQFYSESNNQIVTYNLHNPTYPQLYKKDRYHAKIKLWGLLTGQNILGAAYFRKRKLMLEYLYQIEGKMKYLEDRPTAILCILEGKNLFYFNRYCIWYEYGTGVSTTSSVWSTKVQNDIYEMEKFLSQKYPENETIKVCKQSRVNRVLKQPICSILWMYIKVRGKINCCMEGRKRMSLRYLKIFLCERKV